MSIRPSITCIANRMPLTDADRALIDSRQPLVGIDAAAGAGKTHLACELALAATSALKPWERILFLSHTNAARDVFRLRMKGEPGSDRVTLRTLDSFALDLLSPYARLLDLPSPLRPPAPIPKGWFRSVRERAARLLEKKPTLAGAVATRFPLILADEHQDASTQHHRLLVSLAAAGARVRMFGDALQAILTFDPDIPGWDRLMADVPVAHLSGSWRWSSRPELGRWVEQVRRDLLDRRPVRLSEAPGCVGVEIVDFPASVAWYDCAQVGEILRATTHLSSYMVLTRRNDEAGMLAGRAELALVVHEGADLSLVDQVISDSLRFAGQHDSLIDCLVDFMVGVGSIPSTVIDELRIGGEGGRDEVLAVRRELAQSPSLDGVARAVKLARRYRGALEWTISRPLAVGALQQLPTHLSADDVVELAYRAQRSASESPLPIRCVSTIHKAKGRECQHVVVPSVDQRTFGANPEDRQLLYVALSRATQTVTLVIPRGRPSPLVSISG